MTTERRWEHQGWCRVVRGGKPGPWHILSMPMGAGVQAFCGSKVTGFNKQTEPAGAQPEGEWCTSCVTAFENDQPKSWRKK